MPREGRNQNRMTSTDISSSRSAPAKEPAERAFGTFSADLREFIQEAGHFPQGPMHDLERALAGRFEELARRLFSLQFETVAPYRRLGEARRTSPTTIRDWRGIPALPTTAFKEFAITSLPFEARSRVFHSSGTTAHRPSCHFHGPDSLALYESSLLPWFRAHLLANMPEHPSTGAITFVVLTPIAASAPHSSLVHMFNTLVKTWGTSDSVFVGTASRLLPEAVDHEPSGGASGLVSRPWQRAARLAGTLAPPTHLRSQESTREVVTDRADRGWQLDLPAARAAFERAVEAGRPVCVLGTAFSFVHWLDDARAEQLRFQLPPGSRVLETGGYKGRSRTVPKPELHASISTALGVPLSHIVCEYGMSELSSQAYDTAAPVGGDARPGRARVFRFPPWARALVVSPETGREVGDGETGLLRVIDLANVRSVLAVQTEDLAVRRGRGFELIGRAADAELRGCSLAAAAIPA